MTIGINHLTVVPENIDEVKKDFDVDKDTSDYWDDLKEKISDS